MKEFLNGNGISNGRDCSYNGCPHTTRDETGLGSGKDKPRLQVTPNLKNSSVHLSRSSKSMTKSTVEPALSCLLMFYSILSSLTSAQDNLTLPLGAEYVLSEDHDL